jgi:ABC-type uncharacterized transport system permease subunit
VVVASAAGVAAVVSLSVVSLSVVVAGTAAAAVVPAAVFFGVLTKGSSSLQLIGIPKGTGQMVLGVLIAVFAAFRYSGGARKGDR